MPIRRVTDFCPVCATRLTGRLDKVFCSSSCRSVYYRRKGQERDVVSKNIDAILHRNWVILSELHERAGGKGKFFVDIAALKKKGFHTSYFTTIATNSQDKTYHYVYDFAWMTFSDKQFMVIKLPSPK